MLADGGVRPNAVRLQPCKAIWLTRPAQGARHHIRHSRKLSSRPTDQRSRVPGGPEGHILI
jgi:hypothetical protein